MDKRTILQRRVSQLDKSDGTSSFQPGNDGPSHVRIQKSNANLVDRKQFA